MQWRLLLTYEYKKHFSFFFFKFVVYYLAAFSVLARKSMGRKKEPSLKARWKSTVSLNLFMNIQDCRTIRIVYKTKDNVYLKKYE